MNDIPASQIHELPLFSPFTEIQFEHPYAFVPMPVLAEAAGGGIMDWLRANQTTVLLGAGVLFALALLKPRR